MPRNTTGGSGHKSQRNSESNKARNNRSIIDDLLSDYANVEERKKLGMYYEKMDDVYVGRVNRRMGNGRMEVFCCDTRDDEHEGKKTVEKTLIAPLRGGMRGKGKKSVWVEPGSLVLVLETGLGGAMSHEIVAVFSQEQVAKLRKIKPELSPQLFIKGDGDGADESGIIFEAGSEDEGEVNVEDI
jgi:hypothetical protein